MIQFELVQIKTADGITLPGLLYQANTSTKAAIYLHGNGSASVFYQGNQNSEIVEKLAEKGISSLVFNNRGAHIIKKLTVEKPDGTKERKRFGMAYEKIKECIYDIDGAMAFLQKYGYKEFHLIGQSTGANKICVYDYYKPDNTISKYILTSGGDDTGILYHMLGEKKFFSLLEKASNNIQRGHGNNIVRELLSQDIFAYCGFYDMANPDGDYNCFPFFESFNHVTLSKKPLFRFFKGIRKPTLVIYGTQDEFVWKDISSVIALLKKMNPECTYVTIPDADHGFSGKQHELAAIITSWL